MAISALRIGIEIEVLLCAKRKQDQCKSSFDEFAEGLSQYYNSKARGKPGRPKICGKFDPDFQYWSTIRDSSISMNEDLYEDVECQSIRPCKISGSFAISC